MDIRTYIDLTPAQEHMIHDLEKVEVRTALFKPYAVVTIKTFQQQEIKIVIDSNGVIQNVYMVDPIGNSETFANDVILPIMKEYAGDKLTLKEIKKLIKTTASDEAINKVLDELEAGGELLSFTATKEKPKRWTAINR